MGGSGVTGRGNGIRQTSGQWRRGNRAGTTGLGPAGGSGSGPRGRDSDGKGKAVRGTVGSNGGKEAKGY